jgi:NADH-quinone oxidoreductase subunit C
LEGDDIIIYTTEYKFCKLISFLKKHTYSQYEVLMDITAIDYQEFLSMGRFCLVYNLLSLRFNHRIRLKIQIPNNYSMISSTVFLYNSSNWLEREVWDLFGIFFSDHPDLRRILTDYGFQGFPLRKDFPLSGYSELRYDDELKSIIYEPVQLSQEFRFFDFSTSWK